MRAGRLLSLLQTLQSQGRTTARELADAFDVSIRTIYRDMDALAASGVPVYADRGPDGGYSLLDGYRPELTGLSREEAESLTGSFTGGAPGVAAVTAELGLGRVLAAAALKPTPALPAELAGRATRIAERFHLDAPGWLGDPEHVPTLTGIADAVWNQRAVRVGYRRASGDDVSELDLEPLGVVLKSGVWFVVAAPHAGSGPPDTYRLARITTLETLDARFARPEGFDLWRHWNPDPYQAEASIRLSPAGLALAPSTLRPHTARALAEHPWPTDPDGWTCATIPIESIAGARAELLALGAEVEVVAPPALRDRMRATAAGLASLYG